ncbi:MAG: DUF6178 family protein [Candidatus Binatia bacterium]
MGVPTKESFRSLPLAEQAAQLARVDAKTRKELILSARNSLDLARALSVEMLFYTLKEVGLADSVELLALAAPEQVREMVDLDCWRKDYLDDRRLLAWLMLLDEAGSGKLEEWLLHVDVELLVLLVKRHLEIVRKADVEEDPTFDQTRYFTFDDQYLLRFVGEPEPILHLLLERLRVLDYNHYKDTLEQSLFALETTLEEEAFHWRTARLADRGYPSYAEAREVFRFVAPERVRLDQYYRAPLRPLYFAGDEEQIPPDHALTLLDVPDSFLLRALSALPRADLEQIGQELAYLTNQVVVAEACDPGELAEVRRCVELAHDYLNVGLSYLARGQESGASQLLHETTLHPFFQVGLSLILRLQQRIQQIDATFRANGLPEWDAYLDSPFRETCAGVQRQPPLFFRGLETPGEILYRRFQDYAEVQQVDTLLTQIPLWFAVMRRWGLLPEGRVFAGKTLEVLWNTAFARWVVERKTKLRPLSRAELKALQKKLSALTLEEESTAFVALASAHLKLTGEETAALHALATHAREKLHEALSVDADTADLRFVEGLLVAE